MDSSLSSPQQVPTNSSSTGNPQNLAETTLQTPAQGSSLQNAGNQSIDSIQALDQAGAVIPLTTSTTTATVTQSAATTVPTSSKSILLYGGITLVVAAFLVALIHGLFYQKR